VARRWDAQAERLEPRYNKEAPGNRYRVFQQGDDQVRNLESLHQARANFVTRKRTCDAASHAQNSAERYGLRPDNARPAPDRPPSTMRAIRPGGAVRLGVEGS
jgi:hypothetical protein